MYGIAGTSCDDAKRALNFDIITSAVEQVISASSLPCFLAADFNDYVSEVAPVRAAIAEGFLVDLAEHFRSHGEDLWTYCHPKGNSHVDTILCRRAALVLVHSCEVLRDACFFGEAMNTVHAPINNVLDCRHFRETGQVQKRPRPFFASCDMTPQPRDKDLTANQVMTPHIDSITQAVASHYVDGVFQLVTNCIEHYTYNSDSMILF